MSAIRLATWNTNALFASTLTSDGRTQSKHSVLHRLLARFDIVALQEVHGVLADMSTIPASHAPFATLAPESAETASSAWGGTLVCISRRLLRLATLVFHGVLVRGRAHFVLVQSARFAALFINVHVDRALGATEIRFLSHAMERIIDKYSSCLIFLLGDWNFVHDDDGRIDLSAERLDRDNSGLGDAFDECYPSFTELHQPNFTRRGVQHGKVVSMSRLDRLYCNVPADKYADFVLIGDVIGNVTKMRNPSDHIPMFCVLSLKPSRHPDLRLPIPKYIVNSPFFEDAVAQAIVDLPCGLSLHAKLHGLKEVFHLVVPAVRRLTLSTGSCPSQLRVRTLLALLRAHRADDCRSVRALTADDPSLQEFLLTCGRVRSEQRLLQAIGNSVDETISEELYDIELSKAPEEHRRRRREAARARGFPWRLQRRRITLSALRSADGALVSDVSEVGSLLHSTWQPVHDSRPVDDEQLDYFLGFVPSVPHQIKWELSYDDFRDLLCRLSHSSPGPDGVPYGAWMHAGPVASDVVFRLYLSVLHDGGDLPSDFNLFRTAFIPKSEFFEDEAVVSCDADKLRLIACSNTDAKLLALCLNSPMSELCARVVSPQQRGFVSGRAAHDNIIELEAAMLSASSTSVRSAAAVFFDFANAFPSIAHVWIFAVLERLGVPDRVIRFVRALYHDCRALLCFAGAVVGCLQIESGIKQGCPLSGSLFALAIDPLIRAITLRGLVQTSSLTAYADDIGLVLIDMFTQLVLVLSLFADWARATLLFLNIKKCVVVPLWSAVLGDVRCWLRRNLPEFAMCRVDFWARYLGVIIGPGAQHHLWDGLHQRLHTRAIEIKASDRGMATKIKLFGVYCTSIVFFRLQFSAPTRCLREAYRHAAQRVLAAPWNAFPHKVLCHLCDFGIPFEIADVDRLGLASRARLALSSGMIDVAAARVQAALECDDALLLPPFQDWRQTCIVRQLCDARRIALGVPGCDALLLRSRADLQRRLHRLLRRQGAVTEDVRSIFARRAQRWDDIKPGEVTDAVLSFLRKATGLPLCVRLAVLRTFFNAWPTSCRFQETGCGCRFGCGAGPDRLEHYLTCGVVAHAAQALYGAEVELGTIPVSDLLLRLPQGDAGLITALFIDAVWWAFCWVRQGRAFEPALLASRTKVLFRRKPLLRLLVLPLHA